MNKNVLTIVLVVLLCISCSLGGFFAYKYFANDTKKSNISENADKEKEKNKNNDENKETDAVKSTPIDGKPLIDKLNSISIRTLSDCNFIETFVNNRKVVANDISNSFAYQIVEDNEFANSNREMYVLDEVTSAIRKYFGKDYKFDPSAVNYDAFCSKYAYNSSTKTFKKRGGGCGGTCGNQTDYKVIDGSLTGDIATVNVKVIFTKSPADGYYYGDYAKTNKIAPITDRFDSSIIDKGANYKFTFKLEDGNYVFVSSEPVNN